MNGPAHGLQAALSEGRVFRYVALGDSYTIGTSVAAHERWPEQLVAALGQEVPVLAPGAPRLTLVANLGVNGFTSADLIREGLPALDALAPEFVTMLIGVNDVVQGVSAAAYEANVVVILDSLLVRFPANRIVTIAIPDYTVTPAGSDFGDRRQQRGEIVRYNGIMERLSRDRGVVFVDIFDVSSEAAADLSLVAGDGLHPSGIQYRRWVERILPVVEGLLRH